jgi:acyl-CoA reductase-like NAD-dependent aldehyde dehydrogenase
MELGQFALVYTSDKSRAMKLDRVATGRVWVLMGCVVITAYPYADRIFKESQYFRISILPGLMR